MENFNIKNLIEKAKANPALTIAGTLIVLALLYLIIRHFKTATAAAATAAAQPQVNA